LQPQTAPWRALIPLGLAVLAAHLLVLTAAPLKLGAEDKAASRTNPPAVKVFSTRRIERPAATEPTSSLPPTVRQPKETSATLQPPARPEPSRRAIAPRPQPPEPAQTPEYELNSAPAQSIPELATIDSGANGTETLAQGSAPAAPVPEQSSVAVAPPAASAGADAKAPTTITDVKLAESVVLRYAMLGSAKGLDYHANAELSWRNAGSAYEASMKVSAFFLGSRTMTSRGQITPGGLAPTRFSDKFKSELAAHFDTGKGRITFSANTPDAPLLDGAQDRVSVFFQLGGILAAGPGNQTGATALPLGTQITIYTVGPREADSWTFVVEGEELLTLPAGEMATLKLTRKPRRPYDQTVEIWYAPSKAFMPVRSRITQANGDFIDQQLKAVETP